MDILIHSSHRSDPLAKWRWLSIWGLFCKTQSYLTSKLLCIHPNLLPGRASSLPQAALLCSTPSHHQQCQCL